jgi:hypothetical protein
MNEVITGLVYTTELCGSGLAREEAGTDTGQIAC